MFKRVDAEETVSGFSYENRHGNIECVKLGESCVQAIYEDGCEISLFFYEDIPKLIKALQAAYDYKKGVA
jgi:hypothetical protein